MPIYEYRCQRCGHALEAMQKVSEPPLSVCPSCHEPQLKKLVSAAGFQLKGSGWYATDFKGGKSAPAAAESASSSPGDTKPAGGCGGGTCGCAH